MKYKEVIDDNYDLKEEKAEQDADRIRSYLEKRKHMNIYQKLIEIRKEFHELNLKKSGKNKFANYEYFELKDFVPEAVQLCHKHKALPIFNLDETHATLTLFNTEEPTEQIVFTSPVADASVKGLLPVQSLGSQHTYLRRYLYLNMLDIVESDGIDGLSEEQKTVTPQAEKKPSLATDKQLEMIKSLYDAEEIDKMLVNLKKDFYSLTVTEASKMIKARSKK